MECPSCRGDLDRGGERCPHCGTLLMANRSALRSGRRSGAPANATLAAIVAVTAIFVVKMVGTFWIGPPGTVARVTSFVHLLASCVVLAFLVSFHRGYPARRGSNLAGATSVLIGACAASTLLVALGFLSAIDLTVLTRETTAAVGAVVSLLVAFAAVVFFTALCAQGNDEAGALARAVRFAVAGALVSAVAHAGVFALYATRLMHPELVPLTSPLLRWAAAAVLSFVFATVLFFLVTFYRERWRPVSREA